MVPLGSQHTDQLSGINPWQRTALLPENTTGIQVQFLPPPPPSAGGPQQRHVPRARAPSTSPLPPGSPLLRQPCKSRERSREQTLLVHTAATGNPLVLLFWENKAKNGRNKLHELRRATTSFCSKNAAIRSPTAHSRRRDALSHRGHP